VDVPQVPQTRSSVVDPDQLRALGLLVQAYQPNPQLAGLGADYSQPAQGLPSERVVHLRRIFNEAQDRMKSQRFDPLVFQQLGIRG
jgi:hypothetical protein